MRATPLVRRMSVVLGDDVIRARVAANLRSVSVLVLDSVIGAGEGDLASGLHLGGIRGAVDRDLGDGLALDVVVRAVDDDGLRARGDLDVRVGLVDREGAGGVGLVGILRSVGLAGVGGGVGLGVRARVGRGLGGGRSRGAEESPPDTIEIGPSVIVPPPWPSLTMVPLFEEETTEPSPPKTVELDTREVPSHLAGEMVTPGTVLRDLEAESTTALSALEAKTSTDGTENRGMAGISPGRYPDTVGTDEAVVDWVAAGVVGSAAGGCIGGLRLRGAAGTEGESGCSDESGG